VLLGNSGRSHQGVTLSSGRAKTHVARILQKLDLRDCVQAVIYAYEAGLVEPGRQEL
jgi:hypothetical protein